MLSGPNIEAKEFVSRVEAVLAPTLKDPSTHEQFVQLSIGFINAETQLQEVLKEHKELLSQPQAAVDAVRETLEGERKKADNLPQELANPNRQPLAGDLSLIKQTAGYLLTRKQVPWWLRTATTILGILPNPQHPLHDRLASLQEKLATTRREAAIEQAKIEQDIAPEATQVQIRLVEQQGRFLNFCDQRSSSRWDVTTSYVRLFPDRLITISQVYARAHQANPAYLQLFSQFLDSLKGDSKTLVAGVKIDKELMVPDQYQELPERLKDKWVIYLSRMTQGQLREAL